MAAKRIRFVRRQHRGDRARVPFDAPVGRLERGGVTNFQQAGLALDHDGARVVIGCADQPDPAHVLVGNAFGNPLRAAAGLAGAASAQEQPDPPISGRRELFVAGNSLPVAEQEVRFVVTQPFQKRPSFGFAQVRQ
jgi:hypothetical protein